MNCLPYTMIQSLFTIGRDDDDSIDNDDDNNDDRTRSKASVDVGS